MTSQIILFCRSSELELFKDIGAIEVFLVIIIIKYHPKFSNHSMCYKILLLSHWCFTFSLTYHSAVATVDFVCADVDKLLDSRLVRSIDENVCTVDIGPCKVERVPPE